MLEKLYKLTDKVDAVIWQAFPPDKAKHYIVGTMIQAIVTAISIVFMHPLFAFMLSMLAVVVAGYIKEQIDKRRPNHTYDKEDITFTVAGGAMVFVPGLISCLVLNYPT